MVPTSLEICPVSVWIEWVLFWTWRKKPRKIARLTQITRFEATQSHRRRKQTCQMKPCKHESNQLHAVWMQPQHGCIFLGDAPNTGFPFGFPSNNHQGKRSEQSKLTLEMQRGSDASDAPFATSKCGGPLSKSSESFRMPSGCVLC